jgi:hypothetical protein
MDLTKPTISFPALAVPNQARPPCDTNLRSLPDVFGGGAGS